MDGITILDNINKRGTYSEEPSKLSLNENLVKIMKSKKNTDLYTMTHIADLDGLGSAAILSYYYKIPEENMAFIDYNRMDLKRAFDYIRSRNPRNGVVIIADLSLNDVSIEEFSNFIKGLKSKGNIVAWLDHHVWTKRGIKEMSKVLDYGVMGENPINCGTEIAYTVLCSAEKDRNGSKIAARAHLADFNQDIKEDDGVSPIIAFAITYFRLDRDTEVENLRKLISHLKNLEFDAKLITDATNKYRAFVKENIRNVVREMRTFESNGLKFAVSFGKSMHSSSICDFILNKENAKVAVYVKVDSLSGSMRSIGNIDCTPIAAEFGGGGHPNAAGFFVPRDIDISSKTGKDEFVSRLKKVVGRVFKD